MYASFPVSYYKKTEDAMKLLRTLTICTALIIFYGCSSDDSGDTNPEVFELAGNWRISSYSYAGSRTVIDVENVVQTSFTGIGWEMNMNTQFSANPNNFSTVGTYFVDHLVTDGEGNEILYFGAFDIDDEGTWLRNNNNILLTVDDNTNQGYISILTATELELIINKFSSTTQPGTGIITNITRTDTYLYTKE